MTHDLQQRFDLLARNSGQPDAWILRKANAQDQKGVEI
jgi:predicted DNA-binding protein